MNVLAAKLLASVAGSLAAGALLSGRSSPLLARILTLRNAWIVLILSRLGLYVLVFHLAGYLPQSDVKMFFDQARHAADGQLVYRDFESVYGPLFAYILAGFVKIWRDPRVLILAMIAFEWLAVWVTDRFFSADYPKRDRTFAVLLYSLLPAPLILVVVSGQEDLWIWIFAAIAFYFLSRAKNGMAGLTVAVGFASTKIVLLLGVGALLFVAMNPVTFILACASLLLGYWFLYQFAGPLVFQSLNEVATLTPPSVWFLLNAAGWSISREMAAVLGIVSVAFVGCLSMVLGSIFRARLRTPSGYAALWCLVFALMMILSPKTLGAYLMFYQLPLLFVAVGREDRIALMANLILGAVITVEDSHWFRLGLPALTARPLPPGQMVELGMDVVMLSCLIVIAWRAFIWLQSPVPKLETPPRASS